MSDTTLIEVAMNNYLAPLLAAESPAFTFHWGDVASGTDNYVSLSNVGDPTEYGYDFVSARLQFSIVTQASMIAAATIRELLKTWLQHMKGVYSGMKIQSVAYIRSIDLPDPTAGEYIIASEYQINYQGVF